MSTITDLLLMYLLQSKDVINAARMTYSEYTLYLEEGWRANADRLQKTVEADEIVVEEKRQLQKTKRSILELLRAEEKAEKEQKRELDTAKELLKWQ